MKLEHCHVRLRRRLLDELLRQRLEQCGDGELLLIAEV